MIKSCSSEQDFSHERGETMKQTIKKRGLILDRKRGGMVKCADCQRLLGYLNEEHLTYAYLQLICRCGAGGYLEFGEQGEENVSAFADAKDRELSCPECKTVWFSESDGVRASAFRIVCNCGIVADNRYKSQRKVYQELLFTKL